MKKSMIVLLVLSVTTVAMAQYGFTVLPAKGQSAQRQQLDSNECYRQPVNNTGFDPGTARQPESSENKGTVIKSTAGGAAVGAVGCVIFGSAGTGAAVGAGAGAIRGAII